MCILNHDLIQRPFSWIKILRSLKLCFKTSFVIFSSISDSKLLERAYSTDSLLISSANKIKPVSTSISWDIKETLIEFAKSASILAPNHNNISSCVGSDGYPITDPYVCKALQNNSKTNNSYVPEQNSFNNNYGNCISPEGYPLDPYLCKYQAKNPSIPGNSTINNPAPTLIKQSVEINDKCEGSSEIDRAACELAGEFSGVSTYSQKSSISENRNEPIHLEQVCKLDFFNSNNSWVYETPSPSMPIFKKVYIDGDPWGEDVPIDVPPVIECYNKNRTKVARHAIENNLSMVMDQYFKILKIAQRNIYQDIPTLALISVS